MIVVTSDRFDRCVCGATIRPKDICGQDDDILFCSDCYEGWLNTFTEEEIMNAEYVGLDYDPEGDEVPKEEVPYF